MNEKADGPTERAVREEHVEINIRKEHGGRQKSRTSSCRSEQGERQASLEIRDRGNKRRREVVMTPPRTGRGNMNIIRPSGFSDVQQQAETIEHVLTTCRIYFEDGQD